MEFSSSKDTWSWKLQLDITDFSFPHNNTDLNRLFVSKFVRIKKKHFSLFNIIGTLYTCTVYVYWIRSVLFSLPNRCLYRHIFYNISSALAMVMLFLIFVQLRVCVCIYYTLFFQYSTSLQFGFLSSSQPSYNRISIHLINNIYVKFPRIIFWCDFAKQKQNVVITE